MSDEIRKSIPADLDTVCDEGIAATWSVDRGAYILCERIDRDTWRSMGIIFNERDAREIVDGWCN